MEIQKSIDQNKKLQNMLLDFIEDSNEEEITFQELSLFNENEKFFQTSEELKEFFYMLIQVSNNHHRSSNFFNKFEQIFLYFKKEIKTIFTNQQIFHFFKSNKLILLILIKKHIITFDESIIDIINEMNSQKRREFYQFFYQEIKLLIENGKITEEKIEIQDYDLNIIENKRQSGENDSYLSFLIRNDFVEKFISYVNRLNLSLHSTTIEVSIYETNSFLKNKEPTLIEYAAFFGSIQIFHFLILNNVNLDQSLWIYAIHGQNAEMIHLLEENDVDMPESCLFEAIKCHHNDFANYILNSCNEIENFDEKVSKVCFRYCNYNFFPDNLNQDNILYYLCRYNYSNLVDFLIKMKEEDIKESIIELMLFFL